MKTILSILLVALTTAAHGQGNIEMKKSFFGTKFTYEGRPVRPKYILELMKSDEQAYPVFRKAMANYNAGQVLGFVGGFMIGWPLGTALGGGDPNWGVAAGGAAVILCSIPLSVAFKKHAETAVAIYNGEPMTFRPSFHLSPYGLGGKVTIKF